MKTYTARLTELKEAAKPIDHLTANDIKYSFLKRMKQVMHVFKTEVNVTKSFNGFVVEFTVDSFEGKAYGGVAQWKKWLKADLGIDPKLVSGSRKKHNIWGQRTDDYDYYISILTKLV